MTAPMDRLAPPLGLRGALLMRRLLGARRGNPLAYVAASVLALGLDLGCFLAALALGIPAVPASVAGYGAGLALHWVLSTRYVFAAETVREGPARTGQKLMFGASALVGLGLTAGIVAAGEALALDPRLGKLVAVGASFLVTWRLRRKVIFR